MPGSISEGIDAAVHVAPELAKDPGLAVSAAQSADPVTTAQLLAYTKTTQAHADAAKSVQAIINPAAAKPDFNYGPAGGPQPVLNSGPGDQNSGQDIVSMAGTVLPKPSEVERIAHDIPGAFGAFVRFVDHGVHAVGVVANKPLQVVQHEYKYFHDVEARHGKLAAILAIIPIAAAGTAGAIAGGAIDLGSLGFATPFVNPASLGALAAEGTGWAEGQVVYNDSWERTSDPNYRDPHTGLPVSFGRDVAGHIVQQPTMQKVTVNGVTKWVQTGPGSPAYSTISGVGDALGDMAGDPVFRAGKVAAGVKSAEGMGGLLRPLSNAVGARTLATGTDVVNAFEQNHNVQGWFKWLAGHPAEDIAARFPQLSGSAGLIKDLGDATTTPEVVSRMIEAAQLDQMLLKISTPTFNTTRSIMSHILDPMSEWPITRNVFRGTSKVAAFYNVPLKAVSRTHFTLDGDYGAQIVHQMALATEGRRVARGLAGDYIAAATNEEKLTVFKNAVSRVVASYMGQHKVIDLADLGAIQSRISEVYDNVMPDVTALDEAGRNVSRVENDEGITSVSPVGPEHLPQVPIPDFMTLPQVAKELAGAKNLYGKVEQGLYDHITNNIFKRWVLMTPSFALHVSVGETVANASRLGMINLLKDRALVSMGRRATDEEAGALSKVMFRILGKTTSPAKMDYAADWVLSHDHALMGLGAHHNISGEIVGEEEGARKVLTGEFKSNIFRATDDMSIFPADKAGYQARYTHMWAHLLNEKSQNEMYRVAAQTLVNTTGSKIRRVNAARRAVTQWLDAQPESWLSQFDRHTTPSPTGRNGLLEPHEDWARNIVGRVRNVVVQGRTASKPWNEDLLGKIAKGQNFTENELKKYPLEYRPVKLEGRTFMPMPMRTERFFEAINEAGFRRVLNPIIDWVSRTPLAFEEGYKEFAKLRPKMDAGQLSRDQAMILSQVRATNKAIRFVHNINERTQWAEKLRNYIPFYFAQEQAYKRFGRLLAEDPGAFRRYQMEMSAVLNVGGNYTGPDGKQYFVIPGSGWLSKGAQVAMQHIGLGDVSVNPVNFAANLGATGALFPFQAEGVRPDFGPLVGIPTKALEEVFLNTMPQDATAIRRATSDFIGPIAESEGLRSQFIPNTFVNRIVDIVDADHGAAFYSSMVHSLQMMAYLNRLPPENATLQQRQKFVDEARWMMRVNYGIKALLGLISPSAPTVKSEDLGFPAKLQDEIKSKGSVASGYVSFLQKYPNAWPWEVPDTTASYDTGVSVPETAGAEAFIDGNWKDVSKYPMAMAYLVPPSAGKGAFNFSTEADFLAQSLRAKKGLTPDGTGTDFLSQMYIAAGNNYYYSVIRPGHYAALIMANGQAKTMDEAVQKSQNLLPSDITKLERSNAGKQVETLYNKALANYKLAHPVWTQDYENTGSRDVRRATTIAQLRDIYDKKVQITSPLAQPTELLMKDYEQVQELYHSGADEGWHNFKESALQDAWVKYLNGIATTNPDLRGIIQGVFLEYWPPNA